MKREWWERAEELAEKLGKKDVLPRILDVYLKREWWERAEELAEKLEVKDERLAEIYEHTGKAVEAKNLRNRLKRESKKEK